MGKINRILSCDWLPPSQGGQDGAIFTARDYLLCCSRKYITVLFPSNKSFTDQACSFKKAGYWLYSFFMSLWTSTPSWSINMPQKRPISSHLALMFGQLPKYLKYVDFVINQGHIYRLISLFN